MTFWLRFRFIQIFRLLQSAGWGLLLVMVIITAALWTKVLESWSDITPITGGLIALLAIGALHNYRNDRVFLQRGQLPVWRYFLVDYLCISVFFALFPLFQLHFTAALTAFAGVLWAWTPDGLLRKTQNRQMTWSPGFVPVEAYEWRMIIRAQWPGWILAILLVAATFFHEAFYLAGMFVGLLMIPQGYDYLESFSMLPENRQAMIRRWRINARVMYYWLLPGAAIIILKNYMWAPAAIYIILLYEAFLLLCISYKYAAWSAGRRRIYNGTIMGIMTLFAAVPGGIIVVAGMAIWYWTKAIKEHKISNIRISNIE